MELEWNAICCPLVQAWPACTPWCWWCRPGYGVYVMREKVRPRRKERRRPASIWSCEFSFLQSLTGACSVLIFILIQPDFFFCDMLPLSAHYIILLVESVLFGVFVMVIFYDQVGAHAHTSEAYICATLTFCLELKHLVWNECGISDLMLAKGVMTSIADGTHGAESGESWLVWFRFRCFTSRSDFLHASVSKRGQSLTPSVTCSEPLTSTSDIFILINAWII